MKKVLLLTSLGLLLNCNNNSNTTQVDSTTKNTTESKETVSQEEVEEEILLGKQDRQALEKEPYAHWFSTNYKEYSLDSTKVAQLTPYIKDIKDLSIKVFMGTWCEDSQRETPALYKILDAVNFDYSHLQLITVSREKDTPEEFEKGLDIEKVPTFIFYENGQEMGRYVEFARQSLEDDILAIISGKPYKHSYED